jgi:hypothetical protein
MKLQINTRRKIFCPSNDNKEECIYYRCIIRGRLQNKGHKQNLCKEDNHLEEVFSKREDIVNPKKTPGQIADPGKNENSTNQLDFSEGFTGPKQGKILLPYSF